MKIDLVWFDSLGAKSSCVFVETEDIKIIIDPGIAAMQPSFPASDYKKILWREQGRRKIKSFLRKADAVIISHYHYDHFLPKDVNLYRGKTLFVKNPNEYINESQRKRAVDFFSKISKDISGVELEMEKTLTRKFRDCMDDLKISKEKDFGDYNDRRRELLNEGRRWFKKLSERWNSWGYIKEMEYDEIKTVYPEEKEFKFGNTRIRFSRPLFHGVEYSRVGWVFYTVIEDANTKILHSSDLNGPIIEDYAEMIIKEDPDIIILDGPMTYMFGYLLNRTNLNRAITNAKRIVEELDFELMIYDHHLPREPRFRERTKEVWDTAKRLGKRVLTAAEYLNHLPKVLDLS